MRVVNEDLDQQRKRKQRVAALEQLIALSDGQDLDAELARISEESDAW